MEIQDNPALRLYRRAIAQQWNPDTVVDWSQSTTVAPEVAEARARLLNELYWSERESLWTVMRMNTPIRRFFEDHHFSLASAAHTFDEARHTYVLERYCAHVGALGECPALWKYITRVADFVGGSVVNYFYSILVSETLGEVTFALLRKSKCDPILQQICEHALRDESRHIAYLTEALRRIHARMGRVAKWRTGITLRYMIHFGLKSLKRLENDLEIVGIAKDDYLDYFERKLIGSIRRAGVDDVLHPDEVRKICAQFHTPGWIPAGEDPAMIAQLAALEEGRIESTEERRAVA